MDDFVIVGDYLGTIEEYTPGDGTFAQDGKIFAAKIGIKEMDATNHLAKVNGKEIPKISIGQTVFGQVKMIKQNNIIVDVSRIQGTKTEIAERTSIYVSNISDKYVEKPGDLFAIGDVIKGQVLRMDNNIIDISTKGDYGVVKAFCKKCRLPLEISEKYKDKLECDGCGHVETRKLSPDYGKVNLL